MNFDSKTVPQKIAIIEYDKAFEKFRRFCFSKLSGVEEIIRYGSVKNPGLSDLDVMLVVSAYSLRDAFLLRKYVKKNLSSYILHLPVIIPLELSGKIHKIFPFFEYESYLKYESKLVSKIEYSDSDIFHFICQVRFTKFPFVLRKYRSDIVINIREFLLDLSSFKHSISLLAQLRPDILNQPVVKRYLEQSDLVRRNSFALVDDYSQLENYASVTEDAYEVWLRIVIEEFSVSTSVSVYLDNLDTMKEISSMNLEDCFKLWYTQLTLYGKAKGWNVFNSSSRVKPYEFSKYKVDYMPYVDMVTQYSRLVRFYSPGVSFLTIGMRELRLIGIIRALKKIL